MPDLTDHMPDTSFLEKSMDLLKNAHRVHSFVLDCEGNPLSLGNNGYGQLSSARFFPFEYREPIGGLLCTADDEKILDAAEPHIRVCMEGVNTLLQRELEIQQMSSEILDISEYINFLFQLEQKLLGIRKLYDFCALLVSEVSGKIGADKALMSVRDSGDDTISIYRNLSSGEAAGIMMQEPFSLALNKKDTVLSTLKDGTSVLVSPVVVKEGGIGCIAFLRSPEKRFFTAYEKKLVGIMNHSISSTVETLRLYDNLKQLYLNTVKSLAAAIDAKDPHTHGHSYRVARYSMAIAKELGYAEELIADIEISAYMHDLGKIGVSGALLRKPEKLTEEEYEEIKKHPYFTGKILEPMRLPDFIVNTAVQHHERIDGKGYPYGLSGESIIPSARIVAVADVFDALTSDRPYRPGMPVEKALDILCRGIGTQFDRTMVGALLTALQKGERVKELEDIYPSLNLTDAALFDRFLGEWFTEPAE
ncbi:MAG: HD-GYP domain-containing protein [Alphaproteobacteria bacterium]|uniref:HD-GYP domain-containing protein n=1 Tax=Candidatus Nitrobium versatile TaxID=2884831 RepID=A0A953M380_9BACT|nr:HD-GYP domain-containing protein [Candidatus Nitrobium versatile]